MKTNIFIKTTDTDKESNPSWSSNIIQLRRRRCRKGQNRWSMKSYIAKGCFKDDVIGIVDGDTARKSERTLSWLSPLLSAWSHPSSFLVDRKHHSSPGIPSPLLVYPASITWSPVRGVLAWLVNVHVCCYLGVFCKGQYRSEIVEQTFLCRTHKPCHIRISYCFLLPFLP